MDSGRAARMNRTLVVLAWRVVLDAGFLRVCPIQPHFLRRICLAAGSCPARSHSSSFRIFSGHRMLKMRLRQKKKEKQKKKKEKLKKKEEKQKKKKRTNLSKTIPAYCLDSNKRQGSAFFCGQG
nr:hypothetical protein BaRGS_013687 [Batillaria attramentaria]